MSDFLTLYVDGERVETDEPLDTAEGFRIQVENDREANGYAPNPDDEEDEKRGPRMWVNSAAIDFSSEHDEVSVSLSFADPRGAFVMTLMRLDDGSIRLHVPHPTDGFLHADLKGEDGRYIIG